MLTTDQLIWNAKFKRMLLTEDVPPHYPSSGNAEVGLTDAEESHFLAQINSTLDGLTSTPAINPYYMIQRIKDRLKLTTGLFFDDGYFIEDAGVIEKPLMQVDYLHTHHHNIMAKPIIDNGFLNKFRNGLKIRFTYLKSGPMYVINAQVLTSTPLVPATVSEDK